jgi:hypothetical protein
MSLFAALASVLAGLAAATAAGWAVSRAVTFGLTLRERAAWALASGLQVQALGLLILLSLRARPSGWKLLLFDFAVGGLALALDRSRARARVVAWAAESRAAPREPLLIPVLLYGVAALAWLIFLGEALADSMWATDFLAFWGYKGKVIALTSEIPRRLFQDPALYFAHREYPLLVPLSLAALAAFGGRWNDQALALFYPACALATLLAISGFLERRVSRLAAATAATLASLCAFLYRPANAGTAEIPFALALVLACSAAIDFLKEDRASSALRLALASLFCASLKQEGTLFVFLLAVVLAIHARRGDARRLRAALAALLLPAGAHWVVLYLLRGDQTRRDFDFTLLEPRRWAELPALFGLVIGKFARIGWTEALVPILAIAVFFLLTRRGIGDPLLPVFPVQILFYAIAFTVSSFDPLYAIAGAFRRIAMSLFPAFTLVLCSREIR